MNEGLVFWNEEAVGIQEFGDTAAAGARFDHWEVMLLLIGCFSTDNYPIVYVKNVGDLSSASACLPSDK